MWVIKNGHENIVDILLQNGVNWNTKGDENETALDIAAKEGYSDIARLIRSHMTKQVERQEYAFDLNI